MRELLILPSQSAGSVKWEPLAGLSGEEEREQRKLDQILRRSLVLTVLVGAGWHTNHPPPFYPLYVVVVLMIRNRNRNDSGGWEVPSPPQ